MTDSLFDAIENENLTSESLKDLIKEGADVNARNQTELFTPLHEAVFKQNPGIVNALLNTEGINVNACDISGRTPLYWAAALKRDLGIVKALLGAKDIQVNALNKLKSTPLHAAVQGGVVDPEIIKALIAKRADVNLQNKEGDTPLDAYIKQANTNNLSNVIEIINLLKKDATGATKQKAAELIRGGERFKKQEADLLLANLFSKVITDTLNKKIGNSDITEKIKEILGIPKGSKFGTKKKRSRRRSKRRSKRRSRIKKI